MADRRTFGIRHFVDESRSEVVVAFGLRESRRLLPLSEWTTAEKTTAYLVAEAILGKVAHPVATNETRPGGGGGRETRRGSKSAMVFAVAFGSEEG